jgi:hypothetical protein
MSTCPVCTFDRRARYKRSMRSSTALALVALAGCSSQRAALAPSEAPAHSAALPFIADDYPRAVTEAKARGVPIFVDSWAPW